MVRWLERNVTDMKARIADLGCGNGHLIFELVRLMAGVALRADDVRETGRGWVP